MSEPEVLFEHRGHAGVITLNRPQTLNALTTGMAQDIHGQLLDWLRDDRVKHVVITSAGDKAFCAGGDVRQLYDWGLAKDQQFLGFYKTEYLLNICIKRYAKPYVAIMDGITMGGGIGLFPDVGGTYFLPRCPGRLGMFLGLTGHRLKAPDALFASVATHYVPSDRCDALIDCLAELDSVEDALQQCVETPADAPLLAQVADIDRHFDKADVQAIIDSLRGDVSEWSAKTADNLDSKSPMSLKITHEQLTRGAALDFEDCMRLEYRMVNRIFTGHDFFEGIRAVVIDKDQSPDWRPATLAEVDGPAVAAYFAELDEELPI